MQKVSSEFIGKVINDRKPLGQFYTVNKYNYCLKYTAVDNTIGEAWSEDFETFEEVKAFLNSNVCGETIRQEFKQDKMIEINDDSIYIEDEHGEIVSWVEDEWIEDPSVIISISNAIDIYHSEGPESLREHINNPIFKSIYANELLKHHDHDITIRVYENGNETVNVSLECLDCNEVIIDSDVLQQLEKN